MQRPAWTLSLSQLTVVITGFALIVWAYLCTNDPNVFFGIVPVLITLVVIHDYPHKAVEQAIVVFIANFAIGLVVYVSHNPVFMWAMITEFLFCIVL